MPATIFYFFRHAFRALAVILFIVSVAYTTPSAYADPHAVFYTDRAQEQLFYNTLAALNQADFVEPVTGNFSRSVLLSERSGSVGRTPAQAGDKSFTGEQNPIITSTNTQLPAILSRSITLEGNDLWTAYLVNQFALETTTRRSEDELARILCERGLGRIGCSSAPGRSQQQDKAFVTKPATETGKIDVAINSALSSGLTSETELRNKIADPTQTTDDPVYRIPRPNSPSLAALNANIEGTPAASKLMNILTRKILNNGEVDPDTFTDVTFDSNGIPTLGEDVSASDYVYKLAQLSSLPSKLFAIAEGAYQQAVAFQHYTQNPTAIADYNHNSGKRKTRCHKRVNKSPSSSSY
jgi:hypothetical protein